MESTDKSRIFWHAVVAKAEVVAFSARSALLRPQVEGKAIDHVQAFLDHIWCMGFRPTGYGEEQEPILPS